MTRVLTARWFPWLATALGLALRLVYFLQIRANPYFDHPVMDEGYHDLWAREIADGNWGAQLPFFRAPLYPVLLGLAYRWFGANPPPFEAIRVFQLGLGAITPWLIYRVARRVLPERPAVAGLAALVVALDGLLWYFEADLLLESLLAPLATLLLLTLLRAGESGRVRDWALAGLVLGAFAITRPNILLFAPVAAVLALAWRNATFRLRRAGLPRAAALTAFTCLLVLPVTFANWRVGHDRVLVASQAGLNFFLGNNPEANGWSATAPSIMRVDWWGGYEDSIRLAEEARGRELRPSEVSAYWFERGLDWWRAHPVDALRLTFRKATFFLGGIEFSNNRDIRLFLRDWGPLALPSLAIFYVVMPLAVVGAIGLWRDRGPGRVAVLYALVYAASVIPFFVTARYRLPLRPLLILLALEGARRLGAGLVSRRPAAWGALAAVVTLGVAVNVNPWTRAYTPSPAQYYQSIANIHRDDGNLPLAIEYQRRVLATDPGYPDGYLNLGTMYASQGDLESALSAFERERAHDPGDGRNLASYAQALTRAGRLEEAARAYDDALRAGLRDVPVLYNRGVVLERLGRPADAEAAYRECVAADSTHVEGWNNLGVLLAREGRLPEAVECWERTLAIDPGHRNARQNLDRARGMLAGEAPSEEE
ncbi:MAG: tetratricopeptide repeat protein [bacterium]